MEEYIAEALFGLNVNMAIASNKPYRSNLPKFHMVNIANESL